MIYKHESHPQVKHYNLCLSKPMPLPNEAATKLAELYIRNRGLDSVLAFHNGWYGSNNAGDGFDRVVIPAINSKGVPYWQARYIGNVAFNFVPRYQSPASPRTNSIIIVNPLNYSGTLQSVGIAEGPFDALAIAELGYIGVALMGNNPPAIVWDHIIGRYHWPTYQFTVVADSDDVASATLWQAQLAVRGFKARIVIPDGVKDVAALPYSGRSRLMEGL